MSIGGGNPRVLCANLSEMLKRTLLTFCEVNLKFSIKVEILGSIHIRADDEDVGSILLNESCLKDTSSTDGLKLHRTTSDLRGNQSSQKNNTVLQHISQTTTISSKGTIIESNGSEFSQVNINKKESQNLSARDQFCRVESSPETDSQRQVERSFKRSRRSNASNDELIPPVHQIFETSAPLMPDFWQNPQRQFALPAEHPVDVHFRNAEQFLRASQRGLYYPATALASHGVAGDDPASKETPSNISRSSMDSSSETEVMTPNIVIKTERDDSPATGQALFDSPEDTQDNDSTARVRSYSDSNLPASRNCDESTEDLVSLNVSVSDNQSDSGLVINVAEDFPDEIGHQENSISEHKSHQCFICQKMFSSDMKLHLHLENWHKTSMLRPDDAALGKDLGSVVSAMPKPCDGEVVYPGMAFTCKCGETFPNKRTLTVHAKIVHNVYRYTCTVCSQTFKTRDGMRCHINSQHSRLHHYNCVVCGQRFYTRQQLYRHKITYHPVNKESPA